MSFAIDSTADSGNHSSLTEPFMRVSELLPLLDMS